MSDNIKNDQDSNKKNYSVTINQPKNGHIVVLIRQNDNSVKEVDKPLLYLPEGALICAKWKDDINPDGLYINTDKWTKVTHDITVEAYLPSDKDKQFLITLIQKPNQFIIAYGVKKDENGNIVYTGERHVKSFFAYNGSMWRFTLVPNKSLGKYYLNIVQSDHQVIIVRASASIKDYRAGVLASYNKDDEEDFRPKQYSDKYEYTVNHMNCRVFATLPYDINESLSRNINVNIIQVPHQRIILYDENNVAYTDSAELRRNSKYRVEIKADPGYTPSNITINNENTGLQIYNGIANAKTIIVSATKAVPVSIDFSIVPFIFDSSVDSTSNNDNRISLCITTTSNYKGLEKLNPAEVLTYSPDKPISGLSNSFGIGHDSSDMTYANTTRNKKEVKNRSVIISPSDKIIYNNTKYVDNRVHTLMNKELVVGYVHGLNKTEIRPMMPVLSIHNKVDDTMMKATLFGVYYSFENDSDMLDDNPKLKSNSRSYWNIALSNYSENGDIKDNSGLAGISSDRIRLYFYRDPQRRYLIDTVENFIYFNKIVNTVNKHPYTVYMYQTTQRKNSFDPAYMHMMRCMQHNRNTDSASDKMMLYCRLGILD